MNFGILIDQVKTYQKLESLLFVKTQKKIEFDYTDYAQWNPEPYLELQEEIKEIVKKIEEFREMEI